MTSITAEENTVTITLSRPNGSLPCLLDIPIAHGSGDRPSGTGPYVLSSSDEGLMLTLRRGGGSRRTSPLNPSPCTA